MAGVCCRPRRGKFRGASPLKAMRGPRPDVPRALMPVRGVFAPRFAKRGCTDVTRWRVGALLAPGQRTVPAVLRGLGQSAEAPCHHDPRVRHRAPGSSLAARRRRLGRLLDVGGLAGPGVLGLAASRERRRGERLWATRIDRAPGRSSPAPFGKASGWPWGCLMGRARIPGTGGPGTRSSTARGAGAGAAAGAAGAALGADQSAGGGGREPRRRVRRARGWA